MKPSSKTVVALLRQIHKARNPFADTVTRGHKPSTIRFAWDAGLFREYSNVGTVLTPAGVAVLFPTTEALVEEDKKTPARLAPDPSRL